MQATFVFKLERNVVGGMVKYGNLIFFIYLNGCYWLQINNYCNIIKEIRRNYYFSVGEIPNI